jgi:hypothetical protein
VGLRLVGEPGSEEGRQWAEAVTKLMITKVMAAVLATEVFISNADLRHAASKVALVAASAGPLT